jgi:hypothetical protein
MPRVIKSRSLNLLFASLFVLSFVASACSGGGDGGPGAPGQYAVQKGSVQFDGDRYHLYWADAGGTLHRMETEKLQMVRDTERTYLEVAQGGGTPVLHLREDEPITVQGRDQQGAFSSPWFPFLLGATLGNALGGRGGGTTIINNPAPGERAYDASAPAYRYPPTGSFGRDESLHGSIDTSKPQPPDYARVQPAPYATSGQAAGTGAGTAATNKSTGASGVGNAAAGQSGGTGAGVAASTKGGFASGAQSYSSRTGGVGAGSRGVLGGSGTSTNKPSTGVSGSKGIGGAKAPAIKRR